MPDAVNLSSKTSSVTYNRECPLSQLEKGILSQIVSYLDFKSSFTGLHLTCKQIHIATQQGINKHYFSSRMRELYLKGIAPKFLSANQAIPFLDYSLKQCIYNPTKHKWIVHTSVSQLSLKNRFLQNPSTEAIILHYDYKPLKERLIKLEKQQRTLTQRMQNCHPFTTPEGYAKIRREQSHLLNVIQNLELELIACPISNATRARRLQLKNQYKEASERLFNNRFPCQAFRNPETAQKRYAKYLREKQICEEELRSLKIKIAHFVDNVVHLKKITKGKICLYSSRPPLEIYECIDFLKLLGYSHTPKLGFLKKTSLEHKFHRIIAKLSSDCQGPSLEILRLLQMRTCYYQGVVQGFFENPPVSYLLTQLGELYSHYVNASEPCTLKQLKTTISHLEKKGFPLLIVSIDVPTDNKPLTHVCFFQNPSKLSKERLMHLAELYITWGKSFYVSQTKLVYEQLSDLHLKVKRERLYFAKELTYRNLKKILEECQKRNILFFTNMQIIINPRTGETIDTLYHAITFVDEEPSQEAKETEDV